MTKHTPGPWKAKDANGKYDNRANSWSVVDDDKNSSEAAPITTSKGKVVAFAVHSSNYYSFGSPEVDANAALIAAAPDLLSALANLLAVVRGEGGTKPNAQRLAERAIAKATGEPA